MTTIRALEQLKTLLPGDTPNKVEGEYCFEIFDDFVYYHEPELALNVLVYIAEAHASAGTSVKLDFWIQAREIASHLAQVNMSTSYSEVVAHCGQIIDEFLNCAGN